ncbi:HalOD1 output domain-containing protein [Haloarcula sp. 1CSR25-25]|mgnify:CR=1 FL=1|jgi:hypothetical protein|uniref:HalOD1 output domain-containing protein n=1 Tax=Haloarcula sp. 1CSR25-25 TaxID=2862545 RepID=UPI0028948679|nr:hypothetical protein [Haloarcula sp. 1CSR25-25]
MSSQSNHANSQTSLHTLLTQVADVLGTEATNLPPLQNTIDADSLRTLMDGFAGRCHFTYAGCEIIISGDGTIHVSELHTGTQ